MHATTAGNKIKALKKEARELARDATATKRAAKTLPDASEKARELQEEADKALSEAVTLRPVARLEDLTVWQMEKTKTTKKGSGPIITGWHTGGRAVRCEMSTSEAAIKWMRKPPGRRPIS